MTLTVLNAWCFIFDCEGHSDPWYHFIVLTNISLFNFQQVKMIRHDIC